MNDEELNMQIRRFLKKVGIQSQREIEKAVNAAVESGKLSTGESIDAKMNLKIDALDLDVVIDGDITI
jgi:ribosomal protein L1